MNLQNGPDVRGEKLCKKERISANPESSQARKLPTPKHPCIEKDGYPE